MFLTRSDIFNEKQEILWQHKDYKYTHECYKNALMTQQYTINLYTGNFPRLQTGRATYMSSVYFE